MESKQKSPRGWSYWFCGASWIYWWTSGASFGWVYLWTCCLRACFFMKACFLVCSRMCCRVRRTSLRNLCQSLVAWLMGFAGSAWRNLCMRISRVLSHPGILWRAWRVWISELELRRWKHADLRRNVCGGDTLGRTMLRRLLPFDELMGGIKSWLSEVTFSRMRVVERATSSPVCCLTRENFYLERGYYRQVKQGHYGRRECGNSFFTSVLFLFVLASTLRLCCNTTLHEAKLNSIFIQETQGHYLMENAMHLVRDYAYQLTQNPEMPNIFLGVDAYKRKANSGIINFNTSFSKEQIAPSDFSLQPSSWEVFGGPIFWQDKKKDSNDERYLAEVFMLLNMKLASNLIPDWTMRMAQLMEIERNPLCDFQLYSEGDTSWTLRNSANNLEGPIQINGNFYGRGNSSSFPESYEEGNVVGKINPNVNSNADFTIPSKYHLLDNSSFWKTYPSYHYLDSDCDKFCTLGRICRPLGVDPGSCSTWWYPTCQNIEKGTEEQIVEVCTGSHSICEMGNWSQGFYRTGTLTNIKKAFSNARNLNEMQMTERIRIAFSQRFAAGPCLKICIYFNTIASSGNATTHYPYGTYYDDHYPACNDNFHLKTYLNLVLRSDLNNFIAGSTSTPSTTDNLISTIDFWWGTPDTSPFYYMDDATSPNAGNFNVESSRPAYLRITNNKMSLTRASNASKGGSGNAFTISTSFPFFNAATTTSSAGTIGDTASLPAKLIYNSNYWYAESISSSVPRASMPPHYHFIFDRNRAKWIQLIDFDVAAFNSWLGSNSMTDTFAKCENKVVFTPARWLGIFHGMDYTNTDGNDIRTDYASKRQAFFNQYSDGSYSTNAAIDMGIRIINAEELPDGGMSIASCFPLYIKGDFNTTNTKPKAFIAADSVTFLSDSWQDWSSGTDPKLSYLRSANCNAIASSSPVTAPKIYAHLMTGTAHPDFWFTESVNRNEFLPNLGISGAFRTLEYMTSPIEFCGSLMLPYQSKWQWEPPVDFSWKYPGGDVFKFVSGWKNMRPTACVPFYHRISQGRKTLSLGNTTYNALKAIYNNADATSYTFSTYESALPSYIQ